MSPWRLPSHGLGPDDELPDLATGGIEYVPIWTPEEALKVAQRTRDPKDLPPGVLEVLEREKIGPFEWKLERT